ncbi:MAG: M14 family metallopeptidase [Thermoanaerobaculia bacterium]|nr:M14 family metallopeptidase [Thermoanaerobaculia bacterium]
MRGVCQSFFLLLLAARPAFGAGPAIEIPPDHRTKAEVTSFRATSTYEETLAFSRRLEKTSPDVKLDFFGTSGEGRSLPLLIVSKDRAFTPEAARKTGKPVVLVLIGIHAGEIDGKEASFLYLRDLVFRQHDEVLDSLILLVVPIYNVDGHERISKFNRPNQDGPVDGMGFRTNARGLDLNRDFLKADSQEARALLSLLRDWDPDLFIDQHVTDGADYQATVTVSLGSEPFASAPLVKWMKDTVRPVLSRVEERGFGTAPYVEFVDWTDPSKGLDLGPSRPRYSSGYLPLRHIPSVLVEMHSLKPFVERVLGNEAFMAELFSELARNPKALLEARRQSKSQAREGKPGSKFPLVSETDFSRPRDFEFKAYSYKKVTSLVTGQTAVRWDRSRPETLKIPVYEHAKATLEVSRPAGYLVLPGWPGVEERLQAHGLPYKKLQQAATLAAGTFRAKDPVFAKTSYQGRVRVEAKIARATETRKFPAGSLYIPAEGELFGIVLHLLEPEGPDSLFSWGEFASALENKEWIDTRVLDPLAEEMLKKDPALRAEWESKLADPAFAADAEKRRRFFYSRTPFWDETNGLLPVFRLETVPEGLVFAKAQPSSEPVSSPR